MNSIERKHPQDTVHVAPDLTDDDDGVLHSAFYFNELPEQQRREVFSHLLDYFTEGSDVTKLPPLNVHGNLYAIETLIESLWEHIMVGKFAE